MSGRSRLPSGLVTFMFTDIESSTRLARLLGPGYRTVLGEHRTILRRTLGGLGGAEMFTEGDSFFVAFCDASAALQAGVDAQRALAAHDWPTPDTMPLVRMGLHTGWAEPVAGEYASAEVHRAARVAGAAHGGQVLCSSATARHATLPYGADLVDLGPHRLRGFDDRERLFQLVAPGLQRRFPRPRTRSAAEHNLPAPITSFVGRDVERAEVTELLRTHRLVTVVGAGGAGKTRLALVVAAGAVDAYPQGVWFCDLATVTDAEAVPAALAAALGLRPEPGRPVIETLTDRLADRRTLLVLDTCDVLPAAVAGVVSRLLTSAAGLVVLATGREPLGARGELVWRIPPLSMLADRRGGVPDAVALLPDRSVAARGGRPVPPGETADLERVASRLEGLPLAIELAAVRLRMLTAGQLAGRLDDVLGTLDAGRPATDDRQGSLAATVAWSYRRVPAEAAELLGSLAVFAGPVDLATVERIGGGDALGRLAVLADTSLIEVVADGSGPRYAVSAPTRGYVISRLAAAGAEARARDRHVDWSLQALRAVRVDTDGQPRTLSLPALAPYVPEWRAALRWSATAGSVRHGLWFARGLDPWWYEHGDSAEARSWLTRLLDRLDRTREPVPDAEVAAAHLVHARHAADSVELAEVLARAETSARRAEDPHLLMQTLAARRIPLVAAGRTAEAERLCRDVISRADRLGVPESALSAVVGLAELLWRRGALDEAAELLGSARQMEAGHCVQRGRRTVDMLLGLVALRRGDLVAAHDHLVVALRSRMRYGFRGDAAETVNAIAARCALGGDTATAAMLFGAGEASRGAGRAGMLTGFWTEQQTALRTAAGDEVFDTAYAAGARLDLDQAVAVALSVEHPDLELGSTRFGVTARTVR